MEEVTENTASSPSSTEASPALVEALKRLLRPLVRLLLSQQINYLYLSSLLKSIFIDVAANDFPLSGKRQTDSRLSLLTGVHRKDVRRLLRETTDQASIPATISLGSRLVARWNADADYLGQDSKPTPLPRLAQADGSPSFERLVTQESKDIRPRAVLDEWLRLGIVTVDKNDCISLNSGGFVPSNGSEEKLYFFGRNVRDHLETAVHNVLEQQPPMLERSVFCDGLSDQAIAELSKMSEEMGMEMLRALNQKARALKEAETTDQATRRMTLGVYFFAGESTPHQEMNHAKP